MTDITPISGWFKKAVPNPTQRNTKGQIGCHFERFTALLFQIKIAIFDSRFRRLFLYLK